MMLQFLYGGQEEEVENAIQENMIEVDAVTNDLRKKIQSLGEHCINIQRRHTWTEFCLFV